MKKKAIVIDDGYTRFMVNEMSEKIDVPIICLDEDDDDDDLMVDKEYNVFLDHLRRGDKKSSSTRLEVDNGASDIRRLKIFSCDSKRSKLGNENPVKNRVNQQSKRKTVGVEVERVKIREIIQRDNRVAERRKRKCDDALIKDVPLVRTEEDKRVAVEIDHVERVHRVTEVNDVDETSSRSKEVFVGRRKKNEGSEAVVDKDYMRYLTWLVDSLSDSTTEPMENLQKDDMDTLKESTMVPELDPLVEVKVEPHDDWSDYIIAMGDSPFLDGEECTPFVASKKVVDLDEGSKENESSSSWFRKELMDVLKNPYDEGEMKQLHRYVSIHKKMTRCRELRKGRGSDYETDELGQSYLESFPDFEKEYKLVVGVDKARALKLLRGFFFYLKYVSHDGVFKPWEKTQSWQP
ncbi:hypothetical protein AT3G07730 [Arabidopsis thaliana]|uniref:Uncharacterized protein n=1 Tax=Arabidopsis thaliana TaxID=3702 RepID=A0A1I9LMC1_ARATH|nr:uncharacterized protein AT3G07730 [Arabidopsis thaliana]ANM63729.1 hypothetical protein AT3G07730 [Arabidopsis thaliana]|eukprot:NP_001325801.1 hypothetical protein AT3G07730 [Arabidopsis thaliana]